MQALRDYLAAHEDPDTGRPLFKPMITRGPKSSSHASSQPASASASQHASTTGDEARSSAVASAVGESDGAPVGAQRWNADGSVEPLPAYADETANAPANSASGLSSAASESSVPIGLRAHLTGDSRLITGEALHTQRVKARRSREVLRSEAHQELEANRNGARATGLSGELVGKMREKVLPRPTYPPHPAASPRGLSLLRLYTPQPPPTSPSHPRLSARPSPRRLCRVCLRRVCSRSGCARCLTSSTAQATACSTGRCSPPRSPRCRPT